ncbi:MAG: hypothetical protein HQM09_17500 [Candidatus Riflebacteria bacterium]|nr:hypothetical protein [Candidatus Riflebacteria bacterium]
MRILILEDDPVRTQMFRSVLDAEGFEYLICTDPVEFLSELVFSVGNIWLLSLDHDLSRVERSCGTISIDCGCAVAEFMKRMRPVCPVILHSQNVLGREKMAETLKQANWSVSTVTNSPELEGTWIENSWIEMTRVAREKLGTTSDLEQLLKASYSEEIHKMIEEFKKNKPDVPKDFMGGR